MVKKSFFEPTIKFRILSVVFTLITIFVGINLFMFYISNVTMQNTRSVLSEYVFLSNARENITFMVRELEKYLETGSSENLLNYYNYYNQLQLSLSNISNELSDDIVRLKLRDFSNILQELIQESESAILSKRGGISEKYLEHYNRVLELVGYLNSLHNSILNAKLEREKNNLVRIEKGARITMLLTAIVVFAGLTFAGYTGIVFSNNLTQPLTRLAKSAELVSKGNIDIEIEEIKTGDEIEVLNNAFSKMVRSIKEYVEELENKAEYERKLKEQEVQNLRMKNLLKESELRFLQSQINPHFFFNTLNIAIQLAFLENADRTAEFLGKVSELFRYALKSVEDKVTLKEEIEHTLNYMEVLKIRFGNRISFESEISQEIPLEKVYVPRLILQPIVENAYVHGLKDVEKDGKISLKVKPEGDRILIEISDNGIGMDKEKIKDILNGSGNTHKGIGINNVLERLQGFFKVDDRKELIEISVDHGTKIRLFMPFKEVTIDVEISDS